MQVKDVTAATSTRVYDQRLGVPRMTVIHTTGGVNSLDYLQTGSLATGNPVSCHDLIATNGDCYIIVDGKHRAWHAGVSGWPIGGVLAYGVNDYSIGVEVENAHDRESLVTDRQYEMLAARHHYHAHRWSYPLDAALGHYEIAIPSGRKSDPMGFVWGRLFWLVYNPTAEMAEIMSGRRAQR